MIAGSRRRKEKTRLKEETSETYPKGSDDVWEGLS